MTRDYAREINELDGLSRFRPLSEDESARLEWYLHRRIDNLRYAASVAQRRGTSKDRIAIAEIQQRVAEHFHIPAAEMTSPSRFRIVSGPRQVAMYLSRELTHQSLPQIGMRFGGRNHSTVVHAIRMVRQRCARDPGVAASIAHLSAELQA